MSSDATIASTGTPAVVKAPSTAPPVFDDALSPENPELVIGLVGAVGTDLDPVERALTICLKEVGYTALEPIRFSRLLHNIDCYSKLKDISEEEDRYICHMDAGDDIRSRLGRKDAMALLGISEIQLIRRKVKEGAKDKPLPRTAFILRSLKRPEEVKTLRRIYGDAFHLVAAYSSRAKRIAQLASRLSNKGTRFESPKAAEPAAVNLINRDEEDRDNKPFGQDVRDAFHLADVFINMDQEEVTSSVRRFIETLFGNPFSTPTRDEFCMFHAQGAALRSAEPGRQVGAAIATPEGQILALGTNDVARAGGGLYWSDDFDDAREFRYAKDSDTNSSAHRKILHDLMSKFVDLGVVNLPAGSSVQKTVDELIPKLRGARLLDVIEFMRAVHAEMCSLADSARRGIAVSGCTMYVTTFPCHECAKHIVAAGIQKVVFIEPYSKSQVANLFSDSIVIEPEIMKDKIAFVPFVGVAPRRYMSLFSMSKRKENDGRLVRWQDGKHLAQPKLAGLAIAYTKHESLAVGELVEKLEKAGLKLVETE